MIRHRDASGTRSILDMIGVADSPRPIGFSLENFDAIGAWRDKDGAFPIDPSGQLPGGESFRVSAELRQILKGRQQEFCRCLTEKMVTYAVGRGIQQADRCSIDQIVEAVAKDGNRFQTLIMQVVKSDPFQKRRGQ